MKPITIIDISNYFDLESINPWKPAEIQLYEINLMSKITGEIITVTLDDKYFDILIHEMQQNIKSKCDLYHRFCMEGDAYDGTNWR